MLFNDPLTLASAVAIVIDVPTGCIDPKGTGDVAIGAGVNLRNRDAA